MTIYRSACSGTLLSGLLIFVLLLLKIEADDKNVTLQLLCASFLFLVHTSTPRRPQLVTAQGHVVDAEGSSSLLGRFFMFWCLSALEIAGKSDDLDTMPALKYTSQSANQPVIAVPSAEPYIRNRIFTERFHLFATQWLIVFLRAFFTLGPSYCLKHLLECLEGSGTATTQAWIWFLGMGTSAVAETVASDYIAWFQNAEIAIPVKSQLISSTFQKLLRKKDAKGQKDSSKSPNIISIVSRDCQQLSFYAAIAYLIPSRVFKFVIAVGFLHRLLGWKSTAAAIVATLFCFFVHHSTIQRSIVARQTARLSHDRTSVMLKEALSSLRDIKFSASEKQWEARIDSLREAELRDASSHRTAATLRGIWDTTAPFVVITAALSTYIYTGRQITPSIVFPMIGYLKVLQDALSFIPTTIKDYFYSFEIASRLDGYLASTEQTVLIEANDSGCVIFEDATISWPSEHARAGEKSGPGFSLKNVTLAFPPGELSIISGKTGSGKSLLLAGILGEVDLLAGRIQASGEVVAYAAQVPWLLSATIEENILFGSPMNRKRYDMVLTACALVLDIRALPDGDQTKIGLRGVKLSGGQRTRLSFARALYSSAPTMVLDDIFSSLDTHVAKDIFGALTGELCAGRTRILVTHHVSLCLPSARYHVHIDNNSVSHAGEPDANAATATEPSETPAETAVPANAKTKAEGENTKRSSPPENKPPTGWKLYKAYFGAAGGLWFTILYVFWIITGHALDALVSNVLGRIQSRHASPDPTTVVMTENDLSYHVSLYLCTVILLIVVTTLSKLHSDAAALRAARSMYRSMVSRVLRMPLLWLDSTPLGATLKVFTADAAVVDDSPLASIATVANGALNVLTVIGIGFYTSKYTGIATVLLLLWCRALMSRFNKASPMVQRTDGRPLADILEHITTTDAGIATIRAFRATDSCLATLHRHLDTLAVKRRHSSVFFRWLSVQMSLAGIMYAMITGAFILSSWSTGSVSRIGFSLTFAMQLSKSIQSAWVQFDGVVECMNSVSSVVGYTELVMEDQGGDDVPDEWPSNGQVDVQELQAHYAASLPPALSDVSFHLAPGERVGVVGRTGSGKSTLTLSLLRLLHAQQGGIRIDGVDISTIKVAMLRSRIGFVPQSPTLFEGTVRSNLDYFGELSDDKINEALQHVQLLDDGDKPNGFTADSPIAAGGGNLSQGQRQLLCLARIILKNPKIIILDEATSAVDGETDTVIQQVIRDMFRCTLIVVAHRLETVVSLDRILVIKDGVVAENGSPAALFQAKGEFRNLVEQSQERESLTNTSENREG